MPEVHGIEPDEAFAAAVRANRHGWITGRITTAASGAVISILDLTITKEGKQMAGQFRKRSAEQVDEGTRLDASIPAKLRRRAQFMECLYNTVGGSESGKAKAGEIGASLGWPTSEAEHIADFLEEEGLVYFWAHEYLIGLTHQGIKEIEQLAAVPEEPTAHLPAVNVTINGHVYGQVGVGESLSQRQTVSVAIEPSDVRNLIEQFRMALTMEPPPDTDLATAEATLTALEAQLDGPDKRENLVRSLLGILRDLAVGMGASGAWVGVAELTHNLLR